MPKGYRRTEEELAAAVSKYGSLKELREKDNSTYQLIARRGLMGKLCGHLERGHRQDLSDGDLKEIASRYDSLKEFQEKDHVAYAIIHKRGLFDKLCGHMKRETTKYRTDMELAEIASRYDILKEFRKQEKSAYTAIMERGLIGKLCGHMKRESKPNLSDDDLSEIASRYDVLKDFREKENSAYSIICKRGLFKKLCGHMKRACRDLTEDLLTEIARGYHTRKEFMDADSGAYSTACKRGIIDKICAHMDRQVMPVGYWDKERCRQKAMDYNSKEDFRQGCPSAHGAAQKNGWLDDICSHMVPRGNWFKRKIYVFTFSDGYAYVGLAQDPSDRYRAHVTGIKNTPVYTHIKETGATYEFTILTDWLDKDVAGKAENDYIEKYRGEGWKMLNRMKGGGLGGMTKIYTHKRLLREVAKYEYVDDLRTGSPLFYRYILQHHLWDEYCGKMKFRAAPKGYWNLERSIAAASEFKYKSDFHKKYPQAYSVLLKSGMIDKYFPEKKRTKREKIWTLKKSLSIIHQCKCRTEFRLNFPGAFNTIRHAGLLDKYFPTTWVKPFTEEERDAIIHSCKSRSELHEKHKSVYDTLRRNGLLDKYFPKERRG